MELPVDVAEIMKDTYHAYTDGSHTGYRNHTTRSKYRRGENVPPNPTKSKAGLGRSILRKGASSSGGL